MPLYAYTLKAGTGTITGVCLASSCEEAESKVLAYQREPGYFSEDYVILCPVPFDMIAAAYLEVLNANDR